MDSKGKSLYFVALLGLALAAPYLLAPSAEEAAAVPAADKPKVEAVAPAPTSPAAAPSDVDESARKGLRASRVLESNLYKARVLNLNGGLESFALKGDKYTHEGKPIDIVSTDQERFLPLAVEVEGVPADAVYEFGDGDARSVSLRYQGEGLRVVRKVEVGRDPYQLWLTTRVENTGSGSRKTRLRVATYHYVPVSDESGSIPLLPVQSPARSNGLCKIGGELTREPHEALLDVDDTTAFKDGFRGIDSKGPVAFAGVENVYFLSAIAPNVPAATGCRVAASPRGGSDPEHPHGNLFSAELEYPTIDLAPGQSQVYRTLAYLGPKTPDQLHMAGHSLKEAIETGWFTALAEGLTWLLRRIYDLIGNWGIAIILLTLVVKLVLFPLTVKQLASMARMKELKPELDELNKRYADDREKKSAAMMELYRKRGVNPMAGCLPVLLQLPIWFSLYTSLATNVELFRAPFALWWTDLSSPDPFFALPLALGVLMFVQQKMSPATGMDPVQQKMMLYMMPTMITSFMLFLPAGLCLYMFTNSALSIVQQRVIERRLQTAAPAGAPTSLLDTTDAREDSEPETDAGQARPKSSRPSKAERRSRRGKR